MIDRDTMLSDAQIDEIFNAMPDGPAGFLKSWGYRQFARAVAQKAVEAERKKHQADIELWKAEAAKAELWRGRCLSMDHGDGRTVQQIQAEAVGAEREACAAINDEKSDRLAQEAESALSEGDRDTCTSNRAAAHLLLVCAARIRARSTGGAG